MQQRPEYVAQTWNDNTCTRKIIRQLAHGDSLYTYVLELNKRFNKHYLRSSGKQTG